MNMKYQIVGSVLFLGVAGSALAAAGNKALARPAEATAPMTKAGYEAAKSRIEAQYKADRKICDQRKGNAEELCDKQAEGRRKAETARLEARYKPSPETVLEAKIATADANYEVEMQKCEPLKGKAEKRCERLAKEGREAAVRQARIEKVQATGGIFRSEAGREGKASQASRS